MISFVIVVPEGALGASVGATLDVLSIASRGVATLGRESISLRVVSEKNHVCLSNGLQLETEAVEQIEIPGDSILVFPGLGLDHPELRENQRDIRDRYREQNILQRMAMADTDRFSRLAYEHGTQGGTIAASCSGVLILALTGLLNGREATTHWQLSDFFKRHFPKVRISVNRTVIDQDGMVSAGAAMAQMDLMLYLLRRYVGRDVAEMAVRYLLIDSQTIQARYQVWDHLQPGEDETVRRFELLIETSLPRILTIRNAARLLHISERTLARRVFKVTGRTPMALTHIVRMRHAERLLASTELPLDEVALRVGYANATSLRKLTMKMTNKSPAMLRRSMPPHACSVATDIKAPLV